MSPTQRGITIDRMTTDPGWAGWHYKREGIGSVLLACAIGVVLAAVLFFGQRV